MKWWCTILTRAIRERTIAAIENGHVSRRRVGDGSSPVVLEALKHKGEHMEDELGYHTKTGDGRTLRSSTVYINDETACRRAYSR